ncbi:hypothetical protein CRE_05566 [Caenorhabditis remanei]|uniref:Uncharacterized protein n=1 Tax=Caenorhabditis remanei TaxID=31234 RepID=E3M014_CAERE|nr:hypothetical protein CRE_05566 [Caenorhabditis remanei]
MTEPFFNFFCFSNLSLHHLMLFPCPADTETWLSSPDSVIILSYIKTGIAVPLHVLCTYYIVKKTPGNMQSVKLSLLHFHFWNVVVDLIFNVFSVPISLLPMPATVLIGLLTTLGLKQTIQLLILMTSVSFVCLSTTMIFENRFYLLNSKKKLWKKCRPFWMFGNILFCLLYQIPIILQVPDVDFAKEFVLNALPCVPEFLFSTEIVVPTLEETVIIISLTVFIVVVFGQLVAFAAIIIGQLSSNFGANMLSGSTRRLQKNLLKALIWQTGIPFMYLVLPSCYTTFAFSADYFNMSNRTEITLNNIVVSTASLHGLVNTLSIILIHQPYRSTVAFWFRKRKTENSRTVNHPNIFSTNSVF